MHTTTQHSRPRPNLPPIHFHRGLLKLATTQGRYRFRELRASGYTYEEIDRIVYAPGNKGFMWTLDQTLAGGR